MPLIILRNDITKMNTDAIVNAANSGLLPGGGVSGAIFAAAGFEKMESACNAIGYCPPGGAVITPGFALPARYVIHTVGPVWQGGDKGEEALLRSCYENSLLLAQKEGLSSIAFPLISTGIFGYPADRALSVAISAVSQFLLSRESSLEEDMTVYLVIYDKSTALLSEKLFRSIEDFIGDEALRYDDFLAGKGRESEYQRQLSLQDMLASAATIHRMEKSAAPMDMEDLEELIDRPGETFAQMLLRLIDEAGVADTLVYKRANLDRKLFSKIRSNMQYKPSKETALALAIGLKLDLEKTEALLGRAGYALSPASRGDLIVKYFLCSGKTDIFAINEALFAYGEKTLGAQA
jgi:O-acetyl-ADP-ribose deacetylase (regulator of RNase III)